MSARNEYDQTVIDEFFLCGCSSNSHTLHLTLTKNDVTATDPYPQAPELTASLHLKEFPSVWRRIWLAVLYILGRRSPSHGHWDTWLMHPSDAQRLSGMVGAFAHEARLWEEQRAFERTDSTAMTAADIEKARQEEGIVS